MRLGNCAAAGSRFLTSFVFFVPFVVQIVFVTFVVHRPNFSTSTGHAVVHASSP